MQKVRRQKVNRDTRENRGISFSSMKFQDDDPKECLLMQGQEHRSMGAGNGLLRWWRAGTWCMMSNPVNTTQLYCTHRIDQLHEVWLEQAADERQWPLSE
jgi:hypothetical protein